jgi:diguanylate cyclase (GGDEF)-like protein
VLGLRASARRRPARDAERIREAQHRRRIDDHLDSAGASTSTAHAPAHLRPDEQRRAEREDAEAEMHLLSATLRDIRDAAGADEAIFWRWIESRDALAPGAWSSVADRPQFFRMDDWAAIAQWSAQERLVQRAATDGQVQLAVVPVVRGERLLGVLTISREAGLGPVADGEHPDALARHARQLATILDLGEVRRRYARRMRQSDALLQAVRKIHEHRNPESLAQAICETAVEITSARWAVLVRWDDAASVGEVQYATEGFGVRKLAAVTEHSMVASVCREGLPLVLENATAVHAHAAVFAEGERLSVFGALAIVPLEWGEHVLGAIVIAAGERAAISHEEAKNVGLLGAVAATSLVIVWENQEVSRRANTDPLTGVANRRYFDEAFKRVLSETDRFGGSGSLILVDIDHFKQVNDTYGHDAGDAVLRSVAYTLVEGVRNVDTCARIGGEELALLLPQTSREGAFELADRLRRAIESRIIRHGSDEIRVTASFGVATYPECARGREGVFPAADKALYEAKRDGRNRVKAAMVIPASATV